QLVIPMAASLCFGLATSTILVLVLVPVFYLIYARIFGVSVDAVTAAERSADELAGNPPVTAAQPTG
ncbi:MAG: hypothetical protein ACKPHU_26690, partial [Planctomycetaceae bacterium]